MSLANSACAVRSAAIPLLLALMSTTALSQSLLGGNTTGSSAGAIAIGGSAFSSNAGSIAIGAPGSGGSTTTAAGPDSLALGNGASAHNSGSIAQGTGATAGIASGLTSNDIAIGTSAAATGGNALAAGANSAATGSGGVALGNGSIASGLESFAGGNGAFATGSQATALGNVALASGGNSVAIGNGSSSSGPNSTALGYSATSGGEGGTALGDRANAAGPGTISIGRNSTANQTGSLAIGDLASSTGNRSIALGAGALASGGTVIGGNATGSGGATVVGENASAVNVVMGTALGNGATTTVGGGVALGAGAVSSSPLAPATGTAISVAGAHGNVQVGFNTTDRTLQGAVSIGNATQFRQLQNVADGQNPNDAVNLRQLQGAVQASTLYTDTVAQNLQGQITTNTASIVANTTNIATNTSNITNNTTNISTNTVNIAANAGNIATNTTNIATNTTNIATNAGNIATNATNIATNAGNIATNTTNISTNTTNIATNTANIASLGTRVNDLDQTAVRYMRDASGAPVNQINLNGAGDGGPVIIHNLAPGVLATDAANTGQVQAVERVANNSLQYDRDASGARTNVVTLQGGDTNAPVRVRNVAAGVNPTDAVNLAQMQDGDTRTLQQANTYTDTRINNLTNLWEDRMRGMDRRIAETGKQASAGTALALAASGIRFADTPGKWSLGGATSLYRGQVGLAFGLGHTSQDGRVRFNAAITASPTQSRPQIGAVVGASFILN